MAIPTLDELKTSVIENEIKSYEADITEYLEKPSTISFLENDDIKDHKIIREYHDKELTEQGIEALKKSLEDSGWKQVVVKNQFVRGTKKSVYVSFSNNEAPAGSDSDTNEEGSATVNSNDNTGNQAVGTGSQDGTNTTTGEFADGKQGGTSDQDGIQGNTGKPVNNDAAAVDGDTTQTNTADGEVAGEGLRRDSDEGVNA